MPHHSPFALQAASSAVRLSEAATAPGAFHTSDVAAQAATVLKQHVDAVQTWLGEQVRASFVFVCLARFLWLLPLINSHSQAAVLVPAAPAPHKRGDAQRSVHSQTGQPALVSAVDDTLFLARAALFDSLLEEPATGTCGDIAGLGRLSLALASQHASRADLPQALQVR